MVRKPKKRARRPLLLPLFSFVVFAFLAVAGLVAYKHYHHRNTATASTQAGTQANQTLTPKINYAPPTKTDQNYVNNIKSGIAQQNNTTTTTPSTTATPIIDFAGYDNPPTDTTFEVDAHVNGIVESGGTCTLTATQGGQTVTRSVTAVRNAEDTSCPAIIMQNSDFPTTGTWDLQLSYSSSDYNGTSQSQTVKIQ
jgi:hypothetical protein